jgi:hypothetical protein
MEEEMKGSTGWSRFRVATSSAFCGKFPLFPLFFRCSAFFRFFVFYAFLYKQLYFPIENSA